MQKLIHQIEHTAAVTDFSGVVSIFSGADTIFNKAYGFRDIKNRLPNTPDTAFGIASGTKFFTALGIGVLIERGLLALDTPVGEISPDYGGFIDPQATIQQLLTHTSGIYDYFDEEIEQDFENFSTSIPWYRLETPSDYWPLFQSQALKFRPGERYAYSNGGYVFLGILIEKLSGSLYWDFIQEHVLQAARMPRSGFFAFNDLPENTAHGYLEDRKTTNIYHLPLRGGGDGGMYTTTQDLLAFWDSLFSYRILSVQLTKTFLKTYHTFDAHRGYGCGISKRLDDSMFALVGGDAGVGFDSRYVVSDRLTINILSNITNGEEGMREVVLGYFDRQA